MSLRIFESLAEWQAFRSQLQGSLGFVPTMGALHEGHASLVDRSRAENDFTAVSIFVNPTQFNNLQDLEKYPRTDAADVQLLETHGADFLIRPKYNELYSDNYAYQVIETRESGKILCGASRPGHFRGVLTVVLKLLNLARAQHAYFGEKDFQQLELVEGMAKAFFIETEIVGCPTVRTVEGLALSSRNQRLTAAGLNKAKRFASIFAQELALPKMRRALEEEGIEIDYLEEHWNRRFAAVVVDGVRLIDNRAKGEVTHDSHA